MPLLEQKARLRLSGRTGRWVFVMATTAVLAVAAIFSQPHAFPDDDWTIAQVLAGLYGPTWLCPFLNVLFSAPVALLGRLLPGPDWYTLTVLVLSVLAVGFVRYGLWSRLAAPVACAADGVILLAFWPGFVSETNFSRSAGLFAAAGFVLLAFYARGWMGRRALAAGLALFLAGLCLRQNAALLGLPFGALALLWAVLASEPGLKQRARRAAAAVCGMAVLFAAAVGVNELAWQSSSQWRDYRAFNNARSVLSDYPMPEWEEAAGQLSAMGVSENDYELLLSWVSCDSDYFTTERLEQVGELRGQTAFVPDLAQAADHFMQGALGNKPSTAFWLLLAAAVVCCSGRDLLAALLAGGGALVINTFFLWTGRLPTRVEDSVNFYAVCVFVLALSGARRFCTRRWLVPGALAGACFALLLLVRMGQQFQLPAPRPSQAGATGNQLVDHMETSPDDIFLLNTEDASYLTGVYDARVLPWQDHYRNLVSLGGWTSGSGLYRQNLEQMGLTLPLKNWAEQDAIYLFDETSPEKKLRYVQEHHYPEAALSAGRQVGSFLLWQAVLPYEGSAGPLEAQWSLSGLEEAERGPGWYRLRAELPQGEAPRRAWLELNGQGETRRVCLYQTEEGGWQAVLYLDWAQPEQLESAALLVQTENGWLRSGEVPLGQR